MSLLISIIGAIFAFFIIVLIHESGHFLVARLLNVQVLQFSIGFGKAIYRKTAKSGICYAIRLFPLGGFVQMGDDTTEDNHTQHTGSSGEPLSNQPLWVRVAVVLAGPFVNLLLAVLLFWVLYVAGVTQLKPVIEKVIPHSIAANASIKPDDQIVQIGRWKTNNWQQVFIAFFMHLGSQKPLSVQVISLQKNQTLIKSFSMQDWHYDPQQPALLGSLGIIPKLSPDLKTNLQYSVLGAWNPAIDETWRLIAFHFAVVKQMILGKVSLKSLGGPISIFQSAGLASLAGIKVYLGFLALISIIIGVLNLLPIPGLDGGHLLFYVIEAVIRRPVPLKLQYAITILGVGFLIFLMSYATLNDLVRIFSHSPH